jgi:osmotically-inducible protein OsmY
MRGRGVGWIGGWLLGVGLAGLPAGCSREDADRVGRICQRSAEKLESASGAQGRASRGWQALRGSLSESALDGRVAVRLQWDKALAGAAVRVRLEAPGVVRLEGEATEAQRRRALELAQTTQGVDKVLDAFDAASDAP